MQLTLAEVVSIVESLADGNEPTSGQPNNQIWVQYNDVNGNATNPRPRHDLSSRIHLRQKIMQPFETHATVGSSGELTLEHVPFAPGQMVRVQVQAELAFKPTRKPFKLGLHAGLIKMSSDFTAPLPDSFWLGKDSDAVAS